jgi:hypothetical protein
MAAAAVTSEVDNDISGDDKSELEDKGPLTLFCRRSVAARHPDTRFESPARHRL